MKPLICALLFLCPLMLRSATDPGLLDRLTAAGMSPRTNDAGELVAIYKFKPEGQLPAEVWQQLQSEENLKTLNGMKLKSEDVRQIAKLKQVEELVIGGGSTFEEDDLAALAAMPKLRYLNFHHIRGWEGSGFEHFVGNESVKTLKLHNLRPFKGSAYPGVAGMKGLEEIEITANIHGFEPVAALAGHPNLEAVIYPVREDSLDAFLDFASSLPSLKEVHLLLPSGKLTPLSSDQIAKINGLKNLEHLRAINLGLTQAQADLLKAAHPELEISLRKKEEVHADSVPMEPLP